MGKKVKVESPDQSQAVQGTFEFILNASDEEAEEMMVRLKLSKEDRSYWHSVRAQIQGDAE